MNARHLAAKPPKPTGSAWTPVPEDPATVPVPLPVIIVSVDGPYTEQDRKLWTFLLHAVWDDLEDQSIHHLPIRDIKAMFRDHNAHWIWESAERLADTRVRWIRTEGDRRYRGISSLFSAEIDETTKESGVLRFSFPPLLVPILKDPRRFARLRTHFMIELSGKYAVTLYELLESVANKERPLLTATVADLRQWLKVPDGKLTRWQDLRRRVLEPAIKQINRDPEAAGFRVRMQPLKQGRAIKWVEFKVIKTQTRQAFDAKLQDHQLPLFESPMLKRSTYESAKACAPGWDIYALEADWQAWGRQQKDWPPANPDGAFINFCKRRGPHPKRM
jgi:hypothetical protein